uniref:Uncharacterized protein n=1 Tax=Micrurus corallinus TaxID=54390 RepID=A0A2D4F0V2_MICCO
MHEQTDFISSNNHHYNYCPEAYSTIVMCQTPYLDQITFRFSWEHFFFFSLRMHWLALSRMVCHLMALELDVIPNSVIPKYFCVVYSLLGKKWNLGEKTKMWSFVNIC